MKKPALASLPFQRVLSVLVSLSVLAWLAYQSVHLFTAEAPAPAVTQFVETDEQQSDTTVSENPVLPPTQAQQELYRCEGKQHCSEMSSCDEARFYLKNCPNVLIDGDNDGRPCEEDCGHGWF